MRMESLIRLLIGPRPFYRIMMNRFLYLTAFLSVFAFSTDCVAQSPQAKIEFRIASSSDLTGGTRLNVIEDQRSLSVGSESLARDGDFQDLVVTIKGDTAALVATFSPEASEGINAGLRANVGKELAIVIGGKVVNAAAIPEGFYIAPNTPALIALFDVGLSENRSLLGVLKSLGASQRGRRSQF